MTASARTPVPLRALPPVRNGACRHPRQGCREYAFMALPMISVSIPARVSHLSPRWLGRGFERGSCLLALLASAINSIAMKQEEIAEVME